MGLAQTPPAAFALSMAGMSRSPAPPGPNYAGRERARKNKTSKWLIKRIKQPHGAATTTHHWMGARSRTTWKSPTSKSHFLCVSAAPSATSIWIEICSSWTAPSCDLPPELLGKLVHRSRSLKRVSGQMGGGGRRPRKYCGASPRVPPSGASRPRAQNGQGSAAPPLLGKMLRIGLGANSPVLVPSTMY